MSPKKDEVPGYPKAGEQIRPSELAALEIPDHDGVPVVQVKATIAGTGAGLEEALAITRIHMPVRTKGVAIVPFEVDSHEYDSARVPGGKGAKDPDKMIETTILNAEAVIIIDPDLVADAVEEHRARVEEHRERMAREAAEARGEFQLPLAEEPEE